MILLRKLTILGLVALLTACGSGSGSSGSNDAQDDKPIKNNSLFKWSPVSGATQYELGFEKVDGSSWQSVVKSASFFNCQSGLCSFSPKKIVVGTQFRWFVKAHVAGKWQEWSEGEQVTVSKNNNDQPNEDTNKQPSLFGIKEPKGIYDTNNSVLTLSVKILSGAGACTQDQYDGCTFGQVLNDIHWKDDFKPEVKAEFTTEDGFHATATIRQRGGHTRFNPMKSFRVKLEKGSNGGKVYWQGERKIQLLKSFDDLTRVRHKLSYDLFSEVDHLPSMRSQFVRLKVKDKGLFSFERTPSYSSQSSYKETDMGLYLHVEYFGKEYLARRKWKKGSGIYKANDFAFDWDSDTQDALSVDAKGKPYDEKSFEKLLEIKSGKDHRELINFMEAIHDYSNDFNTDVLGKYLDRDNYITWLAVNILTANNDTVRHNYYLYNPKGTSKFYFVPWDYDFAYNGPDIAYSSSGRISMPEKPPYWYTHASRWGNDLHGRFLEDSSNLAALKKRVRALKQSVFTKSNIKTKLARYKSAIASYVTSDLDDQWDIYYQSSESARIAAYGKELDALANNVETNYTNFLKYFNSPMRFYMNTVKISEERFSLSWGEAVSLQGNNVSYDLIISETPQFNSSDIIEEITGITSLKHRMYWSHSSGQYFVQVIARDSQGNWQAPSNDYDVTDDYGTVLYKLHGVDTFTVD